MADDPQPSEVEWLDIGEPGARPETGTGPPRRRWPRWTPALLVLVAALVAAALVTNRHHAASPAPTSHAPAPTESPPPAAAATPFASVAITNVGHPLLGVTGDWDLFARAPNAVIRLGLAIGRVTTTTFPGIASGGPVSFVVGTDRVFLRPLDFVPGYVIPDNGTARDLPPTLNHGGLALPGPDRDHIWVGPGHGNTVTLTTLGGAATGTTIRLPEGFSELSPDATGYLVVTGVGGVYDARPGGLRRITTGALLAVGPTRWLAAECDKHARCSMVAIDRGSGARRVLGSSHADVLAHLGVISPDGSTAALVQPDPDSAQLTVHLLDLRSGRDRRLPIVQSPSDQDGLVWSPDSRWLFAIDRGQVVAVDVRAKSIRVLGMQLPPVTQLALRASPR